MNFEELVHTYGKDGDTDVMEKLTHKVNWFVNRVSEENPDLAEIFLTKVDLLLNPHFTKDTAEMAVSKMRNKDGSEGEHWSYDVTSSVLRNKKYDFCEADWYVALNMAYSDYYKSGRPDDTYIELACDFLNDIDTPKDKIKRYWRAMH